MPPLKKFEHRKPERPELSEQEILQKKEHDLKSAQLAEAMAKVTEPQKRKGFARIIIGNPPRQDSPKVIYEADGEKLIAWIETKGPDLLLLKNGPISVDDKELRKTRMCAASRNGSWSLGYVGASIDANMNEHGSSMQYLQDCLDTVELIADAKLAQEDL